VSRGLDKMAANCEELKGQVEAFREVAPLAVALRAPGMRQRHWEQLSAQVIGAQVERWPCLVGLLGGWGQSRQREQHCRVVPFTAEMNEFPLHSTAQHSTRSTLTRHQSTH